jgi:hypothetical protein
MKNIAILSLLIFTSGVALKAQNPVFSKTTQQYARLTGATQVMKDSVWDDPSDWKPSEQSIPLGFTFKAFGKNINSFLWEQGALFYRDNDTVINIGFDADLCDYGYGTKTSKSPLFYKKEGTAGNFIVKLEWRSFGFWDEWNKNGSCKDSANLQIWIFQNPQKIEMHFGPKNIANFSSWFGKKVPLTCAKYDIVGNTAGIALDGDPINPTTHAFADTGTRGLTSWPVGNQVYVFTFGLADRITDFNQNTFGNDYYFGNSVYSESTSTGTELKIFSVDGKQVGQSFFSNAKALIGPLKPGVYNALWQNAGKAQHLRFMVAE